MRMKCMRMKCKARAHQRHLVGARVGVVGGEGARRERVAPQPLRRPRELAPRAPTLRALTPHSRRLAARGLTPLRRMCAAERRLTPLRRWCAGAFSARSVGPRPALGRPPTASAIAQHPPTALHRTHESQVIRRRLEQHLPCADCGGAPHGVSVGCGGDERDWCEASERRAAEQRLPKRRRDRKLREPHAKIRQQQPTAARARVRRVGARHR